jgi:hypothetical protein
MKSGDIVKVKGMDMRIKIKDVREFFITGHEVDFITCNPNCRVCHGFRICSFENIDLEEKTQLTIEF